MGFRVDVATAHIEGYVEFEGAVKINIILDPGRHADVIGRLLQINHDQLLVAARADPNMPEVL